MGTIARCLSAASFWGLLLSLQGGHGYPLFPPVASPSSLPSPPSVTRVPTSPMTTLDGLKYRRGGLAFSRPATPVPSVRSNGEGSSFVGRFHAWWGRRRRRLLSRKASEGGMGGEAANPGV